MRNLLLLFLIDACSSSKSASTQVAPTGSPEWERETQAFAERFVSALESSQGNCAALAAALEHLAPSAQRLKVTLDMAGHKLDDFKPDAKLTARLDRKPDPLQPCLQNERVALAFKRSLMVVDPEAFRD